MSYDEIERLLNKYSTKQAEEIWKPETERKKDEIINTNRNLRLFDGINSEYFRLRGTKKDRAKYLIEKLNFNEICPRCSSEQLIVMICYFVECEYNRRYRRENCGRVFKEYKITSNLLDRFMLFLARYGINNTILDKNLVFNSQYIVRE